MTDNDHCSNKEALKAFYDWMISILESKKVVENS